MPPLKQKNKIKIVSDLYTKSIVDASYTSADSKQFSGIVVKYATEQRAGKSNNRHDNAPAIAGKRSPENASRQDASQALEIQAECSNTAKEYKKRRNEKFGLVETLYRMKIK